MNPQRPDSTFNRMTYVRNHAQGIRASVRAHCTFVVRFEPFSWLHCIQSCHQATGPIPTPIGMTFGHIVFPYSLLRR